ncbi:hypothetical protein DFH07DRAFT_939819 [Mycena maculata]|uniref:Uncharacterized protein n=1 Tax=Mycena maculata TaxID=230809 RepID=A0AAD7NG43_9AGAR|nr:hypothetical protein DFH07DRAFT_939819 [Mycena maculata]
MPTVIHSAVRPGRSGSSPELQKLVLCLGVVAAFIFTSFGIAKLLELVPNRRQSGRGELIPAPTATRRRILTDVPPGISAPQAVLNPISLFPSTAVARKGFPQDFHTGAIRYTKTSPYLQHISAPHSYAMRHRRRVFRGRPGPSPLRNVINPPVHARPPIQDPPTLLVSANRSHSTDPAPVLKSMPAPKSTGEEFPARTRSTEISPACALSWSSIELLHRTSNAVVGAHPDAIPLIDRASPAVQQTSFPWVPFNGVGANFKFGLVRGNNAAFAHGPPVRVKHTLPFGRRGAMAPPSPPKPSRALLKSRGVNVVKSDFVMKDSAVRPRTFVRGNGKENAAVA